MMDFASLIMSKTVPPGTDMNQSAISKPDLSLLNVVEKQGKPFRIGDLKNSSVTWTGTPNSTTTVLQRY